MKKSEILYILQVIYILITIVGIVVALFNMYQLDGSGNKKECEYHSISSFTNIGYIATCELLRERF